MSTPSVRLRFFASARAVMGVDELEVAVDTDPGGSSRTTIADALQTAGAVTSDPTAQAVFSRCSFLVNGVATTDRGAHLDTGDFVDVMPPFAGG